MYCLPQEKHTFSAFKRSKNHGQMDAKSADTVQVVWRFQTLTTSQPTSPYPRRRWLGHQGFQNPRKVDQKSMKIAPRSNFFRQFFQNLPPKISDRNLTKIGQTKIDKNSPKVAPEVAQGSIFSRFGVPPASDFGIIFGLFPKPAKFKKTL